MADLRVGAVWDAGNYSQFLQTTRNTVAETKALFSGINFSNPVGQALTPDQSRLYIQQAQAAKELAQIQKDLFSPTSTSGPIGQVNASIKANITSLTQAKQDLQTALNAAGSTSFYTSGGGRAPVGGVTLANTGKFYAGGQTLPNASTTAFTGQVDPSTPVGAAIFSNQSAVDAGSTKQLELLTQSEAANAAQQDALLVATQRVTAAKEEYATSIKGNITNVEQETVALEASSGGYDKQVTAISKASDSYSGLGRVIQRTAEYAVVAGLAYAGFGAAVGQISSINELNTNLTKLGITSGLSATEVTNLFTQLTTVAYQTATPLNELVSSADDIALAVKRAGDSTQQYESNIISLTQAVGILTNLSGIDTVDATDKLTAAFKQLGVAPSDLIGILDKVTAVAGGQSTAIGDIVTGLGSVAAAAKTAGLSTDQMIASLQVLGQVTSKSPADLATAFKNLFGALDSPGSIKVLQEFGIAVRDQAGNVRPFLEVYQDIADAIAKGVIPAGQIETVLRGISGGPRRAPDAAALLNNLPSINTATTTSINATNQALVANAQILDTTAAKVTQLGVAFDATIFTAFNKQVQETVNGLISLGLQFTNIIKFLPEPQILSAVLAIVSLVAGVKLATGVLGVLGTTFKAVGESAIVAADGITVEGAAASKASITSGGLGSTLGKIGVGAALGAGVSLASGGQPGDIIGSALTSGGLFGVQAGLATGNVPLALASGLAVLAGQALPNFTDSTKQSTAASAADQQQLLQNITTYQTAQQSVQDLNTQQDSLGKSITGLLSLGKLSADQQSQLNDLQGQYAKGVVDSITANKQLADSFQALGSASQLSSFYSSAVASGNYSPDQLNTLKQQLTQSIIQQTSPDFLTGGKFNGVNVNSLQPYQPFTNNFSALPTSPTIPIGPGFQIANSPTRQAVPGGAQLGLGGQVLPNTGYNPGVSGPPPAGYVYDPLTGVLRPDPSTQGQIDKINSVIPTITDAQIQAYNQNAADYSNYISKQPFTAQNASTFSQGRQYLPQTGSLTGTSATGSSIDFTKIATGAESVTDLFSKLGDKVTGTFQLSNQSIAAVNAGIQNLSKSDPALAATIGATWSKAIDLADTYSYTLDNVAKNLDIIQAQQEIGLLTPQQAADLTGVQNATSETNQAIHNLPTSNKAGPSFAQSQLLGGLSALSASPESASAQKDFADSILKNTTIIGEQGSAYDNVKAKGTQALKDVESQIITALGLTSALTAGTNTLSTAYDAQNDAIRKGSNTVLTDLAQKEASLQAANQGGQYSKDEGAYTEQVNQINALFSANTKLKNLFTEFPSDLSGFEQALTHVNGLQGATLLTADQLIPTLITEAETYGLNAQQVNAFVLQAIALYNATNDLNGLVAKVNIQVAINDRQGNDLTINQLLALQGDQNAVTTAKNGIKANQLSINDLLGKGAGSSFGSIPGAGTQAPAPSLLDLNSDIIASEKAGQSTQSADIATIIANAKKLQDSIPGEAARNKQDIVEILNGTTRIAQVRGISEDILSKSMTELAAVEKARLDADTKADTIRRIRVGAGDFAAIANVPFNAASGVSSGGANGPINVNLNIGSSSLTPAQFTALANKIAAVIKSQIAAS